MWKVVESFILFWIYDFTPYVESLILAFVLSSLVLSVDQLNVISGVDENIYFKDYRTVFFSHFFLNLLIYFLAALGLRCCTRTFSCCGEWGLLFLVVHGLFIVVASRCGARAQ